MWGVVEHTGGAVLSPDAPRSSGSARVVMAQATEDGRRDDRPVAALDVSRLRRVTVQRHVGTATRCSTPRTRAARAAGDVDVQDAAAVVAQNHEDVQQLERQSPSAAGRPAEKPSASISAGPPNAPARKRGLMGAALRNGHSDATINSPGVSPLSG